MPNDLTGGFDVVAELRVLRFQPFSPPPKFLTLRTTIAARVGLDRTMQQ